MLLPDSKQGMFSFQVCALSRHICDVVQTVLVEEMIAVCGHKYVIAVQPQVPWNVKLIQGRSLL